MAPASRLFPLLAFLAAWGCGPAGQPAADEERAGPVQAAAAEDAHEGHADSTPAEDPHAEHAMPAADQHAGHTAPAQHQGHTPQAGAAPAQHQGHTPQAGAAPAQHRDHGAATPAGAAGHQMHAPAAVTAGVQAPRGGDEGHARLMELVRGLLADSAVQRRIQADTGLRRLWSDTAVRNHVLGGDHRH